MPTVLVVDDEPDLRLMLRTTLAPQGWAVEEAESGRAAVERCRTRDFDAIVMDHRMPGMSGIDAAAALQGQGYTAPVVIYTAYLDRELEWVAAALHVRVVSKAADLSELFDALPSVA